VNSNPKRPRELDPERRAEALDRELLAVRAELTARRTLLGTLERVAKERQATAGEYERKAAALEAEVVHLRTVLAAQTELAATQSREAAQNRLQDSAGKRDGERQGSASRFAHPEERAAKTGPRPGPPPRLRRWLSILLHERRCIADIESSGLFDREFYLRENPDVAKASVDALRHYLRCGAIEGRWPNPLFDPGYYLAQTGGEASANLNPLCHYIQEGWKRGLNPHPLFSTTFYLELHADVAARDTNPLAHYLRHGGLEGRDPHPAFSGSFYQKTYPDVVAAGLVPLLHFLSSGANEGRSPSPLFDTAYYLETNPDVRASGLNPLVHFLTMGKSEGRRARRLRPGQPDPSGPPMFLSPWFAPIQMTSAISPYLTEPTLNVLLPRVGMGSTSGGPNTAIILACKIAGAGVPVRLVSTDLPLDADIEPFRNHIRTLIGDNALPRIEFLDGHNRNLTVEFGPNDCFLATAWWTAQQARFASRGMASQKFVYMIQDFEPLLYDASTRYALALETYALDHVPVVNTRVLFDYLVGQRIGRFADPDFARQALVFQPALDRTLFRPRQGVLPARRRRLLFYARPETGSRNLFEMGTWALQGAILSGDLDPGEWEFWGIGPDKFAPVSLGGGAVLRHWPWQDITAYASLLRESDVLLSLMLSPHPSYPPLDMAASGGLVVTNSFANKTADTLTSFSENIVVVDPTVESIVRGLGVAACRVDDWGARRLHAAIDLPSTWDKSLEAILPALLERLRALLSRKSEQSAPIGTLSPSLVQAPASDDYSRFRRAALERRRVDFSGEPEPNFLSFLTTVWDTDPSFLMTLAASVLGQDAAGSFEWVLLDNGSTNAGTRRCLAQIAADPRVRLLRVEENLGIVGGMRYVIERANNRYVAPLDSDDLLTTDAVRVVARALANCGYPAIAFTDEDRLEGHRTSDPYFKPGWDPVLFSNSCYIAHLGAFDRKAALDLGVYTDPEVEGSHDWDTFTRFLAAGHTPLHIPEVVYSWRVHEGSTSANMGSKPFVYTSQTRVLARFLAGQKNPRRFYVEASPFFNGMPDWWIRLKQDAPRPITTVAIGGTTESSRREIPDRPEAGHEFVRIAGRRLSELGEVAFRCASEGRLIHLVGGEAEIDGEHWALEALAQMELFPDTVIVGGRIHDGENVLEAGGYLGFGRGADSPDRGRRLHDPGYFAQMLKPHSVGTVPVQHCVIDPAFLMRFLDVHVPAGVGFDYLSAWLGAFAQRERRRVIYSPFFSARLYGSSGSAPQAIEISGFRRANREMFFTQTLLPLQMGLSAKTAYQPTPEITRKKELADTEAQLDPADECRADAMARRIRWPPIEDGPTVGVATCVYGGSPVELFRKTAASVTRALRGGDEWIVLLNGPVSGELAAVVEQVSSRRGVRVIVSAKNLGIIDGLSRCLHASVCDLFAVVDGDDLLEPDALQVISAAARETGADFLFTDEGILKGDEILRLLRRGPFDPVLALENSYIWHLCAFDRRKALALGAYSDNGSEFCQDWDVVMRFARSGAQISHVPHVLYHWRTHEASQSNAEKQNEGSVLSTRNVLEQLRTSLDLGDHYQVAPFPRDRGAFEWYLRRLPEALPTLAALIRRKEGARGISEAERSLGASSGYLKRIASAAPRTGEWESLLQELMAEAEFVVVLDEDTAVCGQEWLFEAVKYLEIFPDAAMVGGRILDARDHVIEAATGSGGRGEPLVPLVGKHRTDPGDWAFALKAHTTSAPTEGFFVARCRFLADAGRSASESTLSLAALLGRAAAAQGLRVVYAPLIEGRSSGHEAVGTGLSKPAPKAWEGAPRIVSPSDWQELETRPEFWVKAAPGARLVVRLFPHRHPHSPTDQTVARVTLRPSGVPTLLYGRPDSALAEDNYVAALEDADTGHAFSWLAIQIREVRDRWVKRFEGMLAEQARFTGTTVKATRQKPGSEPLFSITTTVYDTDPVFVSELADSILGQRCADFEWLLLDNGSQEEGTIRICQDIAARDPRVRFFRTERNLHIIGGNRYVLERANGTYIVPVDADDLVYPDALRILQAFIQDANSPDLLFSEEQKVFFLGTPYELIWRPAWSGLFSLSTCPASHLMALRRTLALEAKLYTDDYALGSHDWDSALRLEDLTSRIVRVPYVLYGWRMHPGSAAMSEDSKNYLADSQIAVVRETVKRRGLADRFEVIPAHTGLGYYHARPLPGVRRWPGVLLHAVLSGEDFAEDLASLKKNLTATRLAEIALRIYVPDNLHRGIESVLQALNPNEMPGRAVPQVVVYGHDSDLPALMFSPEVVALKEVHAILNPSLSVTSGEWLIEAVSTFALDPVVGIVGGCVTDEEGKVQHIGYSSGLDGFFATPAYGGDTFSAYGAIALIRRHVTAVYGSFTVLHRRVLEKIGAPSGIDRRDGLHGIEYSLRAAAAGFRVAYSPHTRAVAAIPLAHPAGSTNPRLREEIRAKYGAGTDPFYSPQCFQTADADYYGRVEV